MQDIRQFSIKRFSYTTASVSPSHTFVMFHNENRLSYCLYVERALRIQTYKHSIRVLLITTMNVSKLIHSWFYLMHSWSQCLKGQLAAWSASVFVYWRFLLGVCVNLISEKKIYLCFWWKRQLLNQFVTIHISKFILWAIAAHHRLRI